MIKLRIEKWKNAIVYQCLEMMETESKTLIENELGSIRITNDSSGMVLKYATKELFLYMDNKIRILQCDSNKNVNYFYDKYLDLINECNEYQDVIAGVKKQLKTGFNILKYEVDGSGEFSKLITKCPYRYNYYIGSLYCEHCPHNIEISIKDKAVKCSALWLPENRIEIVKGVLIS